jgi:uroporphyrinogen decarboxylase
MNGKERIASTLHHQEPDRVPYDLAGTTVTAITKNAYKAAMEYRGLDTSYEPDEVDPISQIVTPLEDNLVKLKSDTRRIGAQRITDYRNRVLKKGDIEYVTDFYGCEWMLDPKKDLYFNQTSYPLKQYQALSEGLDALCRPDWDDIITHLYTDLNHRIRFCNDYACVADRNTAGFTENSLRIRGYEEWYLDTMMDPAGVEGLLEIILRDKIRYWDAVIDWAVANRHENTIQVISECDDLGSQSSTIIDPDSLRKIVIPRLKSLFTHIKKRLPHVKIFMHSCGSIRPLIPDLIDAGLDILNPIQWTAVDMNVVELKRDFGKELTFWGGGVDTQTTLNKGTPQEVSDEVKRLLDILAPGGGFVFAPVHNIQDDVSPENFWAMWDTLMAYGKY